MKPTTLSCLAVMTLLMTGLLGRAGTVHDFVTDARPVCMGSYTQGEAYAHDLYQKLTGHGVHACLVYFNWGERSSAEKHAAFVVYRDEQGRYWGKQSIGASKWLHGTTPQEWAESFYPDKIVSIFAVSRPMGSTEMLADDTAP